MKEFFKIAGSIIGLIIALLLLFSALGLFGLSFNRLAAPFAEETRTQTYEKSRAYQQGMALDIADLCRQWRKEPDAITKAGIAATILQRADRYDWDKLPSQQRRCLEEIDTAA